MKQTAHQSKFKCPEIPTLDNYSAGAHSVFWKNFPKADLPTSVKPRICVDNFISLIKRVENKLTASQKARAWKTIDYLLNGAPAHQKSPLPPCFVRNGTSAFKYGREVTDTVACWIKNGFACGPFDNPPFKNLRVNPIMAVPQDGKVRVVLNVSMPDGASFNDNIDDNSLERLHMSSAKLFGFILKKCGRNATFSKTDLKDAYKNMPAKLKELYLQGFFWLDKYFVENAQIFGARSAVCNFDVSGNTLNVICTIVSDGNDDLVCRHLDDNTNVSPANSDLCERFTSTYKDICAQLNIHLAEDCPKLEKAFSNSTKGRVLGINFDSSDLSWSLPEEKRQKILRKVHLGLSNKLLDVTNMQKLMGHLNYVSSMCPFLNGFKRNMFDDLGYALRHNHPLVRLSAESRRDLLVWTGFLMDTVGRFPIPSPPCHPPLFHKQFTSDAAGCADSNTSHDTPGCASIGLSEDGEVVFAFRIWWKKAFITERLDREGKRFGNKTTFLESIGLLLPFLLIPSSLRNQHIVLGVDNMGCVYAWSNKYSKEDVYTSIIVRSLLVVSSYLCCVVHVKHVPRRSTWESVRADNMSRASTSTCSDDRLLDGFGHLVLPECFSTWLANPSVDWSLPLRLLSAVKKIC